MADVIFTLGHTPVGSELNPARYKIIEETESGGVEGDNPHYQKNYTIRTLQIDENDFFCNVQFGNDGQKISYRKLHIKTYYNCKKADISSVNLVPGMKIEYMD